MLLPSDHYAAVVSFVQGIDSASEGDLLDGFDAWLSAPKNTSWAWWGQIERSITGVDDGPGGVSDMFDRLSSQESAMCTEALLDALERFFSERTPERTN
jgi:hypothetical protein